MISAWNLLWIVPLCLTAGFFIFPMCRVLSDEDRSRENGRESGDEP